MAEGSETRWTTVGSEPAYAHRMRLVERTVRLPDGSSSRYAVDESVPFAAAVLLLDGEDLVLTRQYRYPIDRWIYDLPGGGPLLDETPERTARRELEEETGIRVDELRPLHVFFSNPGRASWPVHIFFAGGRLLEGVADRSDPSEEVRLVRMPLTEFDRLVLAGEIVDPTLLIARGVAALRGLLPPASAVPA